MAAEVKTAILRALGDVAPEADLASLKPEVPLREQLDLDSMDILNFVVALHGALGVEIPEADYPRLATLDACVEYLEARRRS
jgi:acyl carrier protein